MALLSDLTREPKTVPKRWRLSASALVSLSIAMVLGAVVTHSLGLNALFWMIAALATTEHSSDDLGGSQQYQP